MEEKDISFLDFRKEYEKRVYNMGEYFNLGIVLKNKFNQYLLAE